ncbi:MAG: DUF2236 domain-containing protein [Chloroflexi bacterium]|nr:DUF2236 domain-containing protein [Chloroflexota bacterium]
MNRTEYRQHLAHMTSRVENPAHGFFGPGSMAWRINREGALGLGALRALLMQVAHPKVAQGVADHSNYRGEPIRRVLTTLRLQQVIVFGSCQEASEALRRIYGRHESVVGKIAGKTQPDKNISYNANDPLLQLWVFATLVDTMVRMHDQLLAPLSADERAAFYQDSLLFADLMGIPNDILPANLAEFDTWIEDIIMSDEIVVTSTAKDIASSLLRLPVPVFWPTNYILAAGSLPPVLRQAYGLKWNAAIERTYVVGIKAVQVAARGLPKRVRWLPPYWRAMKRIDIIK